MITRKLGALIRGDSTPFQLMLACIVGAVIGFLPGFSAAPGLFLLFLVLLIVFNANLFLAGLVILGATLLSYLLLPVSFQLGRLLVDGPTSGLLTWAINAPVLAWFGFETYVATGGVVLGLIVGIVLGIVIVKLVRKLRRQLAGMKEGSEAYAKWMAKPIVRIPVWLLFGSESKKSFEETDQVTFGKMIRPLGVVLVVLFAVLLFTVSMFLQDVIVTTLARSGLERVNGASVDLERVSIDLAAGDVVVEGVALVNPDDLMRNSFSATRITAELSGMSLLRKKAVIDRLEIVEGRIGEERRYPGTLVGPRPKPPEPITDEADAKSLDEYIETAQTWRTRLSQARRWIDRFISGDDADEAEVDQRVSLSDRLRQQAEATGYASVRAEHRIVSEPTLTIRELAAEGVKVELMPEESLRIAGRNLSTQPYLLESGPQLEVISASGDMRLVIHAASMGSAGEATELELLYRGYPVDDLRQMLRDTSVFPLSGGTIDLSIDGQLSTADMDLPVEVTLKNTEVTIPGAAASRLDSLVIPVVLRGPMDNPQLAISDQAMADALLAAGKGELTRRLTGEAQRALGDRLPTGLLPTGNSSTDEGEANDEEGQGSSARDAIKGLFQ